METAVKGPYLIFPVTIWNTMIISYMYLRVLYTCWSKGVCNVQNSNIQSAMVRASKKWLGSVPSR